MNAKDLKNALLQEAVQGKLVPQIASEGNARDLLEEIRKEKLSHGLDFANAKSGKKKSKKETALAGSNPCDIKEEEIPFDIPENWCWCRLGELINFIGGYAYDSHSFIENSDYQVLRLGNVKNGYLQLSTKPVYIDFSLAEKTNAFKCITNDILVTMTGTRLKRDYFFTTLITENDKNLYVNQRVGCLRPKKNIYAKFLTWILKSKPILDYIFEFETGTANQGNLGSENIKKIPIPLPPLAEQKRIVSAIEKFMPLIEEYGKKETELKAFNEQIGTLTKKAILQEAVQGKLVPQIASEGNARDLLEEIRKEKLSHGLDFANAKSRKRKSKKETALAGSNPCDISDDEIPFDIPENWCWCRLSELCNLYTGDSINETEKKLKYTNIKEGWFYIGTKDVNFDQTINYDNGIKIPFEKENFRIAPKNTVLMCIEGGSAGRKIAFTNQDVCFGNKLCCFNSYKNEIEKFIFYFLQSTLFTDAFKDNINGIIGGVSINNLKEMLFPLPPLAEQKRIVAAIEKMLPLCEKLGE